MEQKTVPLAEFKISAGDGPGEFEGRAAQFNGLDSYGDTILKGAFAKSIPSFLERGFLGAGHDWTSPIGYFTSAEERPDGLYVKGRFHSDPEAQMHRTRARERMEAGRFVGLSIGYVTKQDKKRDDGVRELHEVDLFETSLVTVPADRGAGLTAIKSGLPFQAEAEAARDAVLSFAERAEQLVALREAEGRKAGAELNAENWQLIADLEAALAPFDGFGPRLKALLARREATAEQAEPVIEPVVLLSAQLPPELTPRQRWLIEQAMTRYQEGAN